MKFLSSLSCLLALSCLLQFNLGAQTSATPTISIQGTLKNANGGAIADGDKSVTFRLFDNPETGTEVWAETATVSVTDGIYSHLMGSENPLQAQYFTGPRYVEVVVDNVALRPRTTLSYAPYALVVETSQSALAITAGGCSGQVGDIKYSILKPADFAMENGDCWVPMDGRNIANTKLATYIGTVLPDAGGVFLRAQEWPGSPDRDPGRDAVSTIGQLQEEAFRNHEHGYSDSRLGSWQNNYTLDGDFGQKDTNADITYPRSGLGTLPNGFGTLQWANSGASHFGLAMREDALFTGFAQQGWGAETRPDNMNFYVYIRIN